MKRTQIYLDESQSERLDRRASQLGATRSELIREAIGAYLEGGSRDRSAALARFRSAVAEAAGSAPRLARGHEYVDSVRAADLRRLAELDRQRGE